MQKGTLHMLSTSDRMVIIAPILYKRKLTFIKLNELA
jgi:hypothetical protein